MEENQSQEKIPKNKYYMLENGIVSEIDANTANDLLKNGVYHTFGKINDFKDDVVIFDLDKDSAIPLLRFLQTYSPEGEKSNFPIYIGVGLLALVVGFLFLSPGSSENQNTPSENNSLILQQQSLERSSTPQIDPEQIKNEIRQEINANSNEATDQIRITQLEDTIRRLQLEAEDSRFYNARIVSNYDEVNIKFQEAKEELRVCMLENIDLEREKKQAQNALLENNQLYLYLGKKVFDLCEKQEENAECKQLIFDFYNLKKQ